MLTSIQTPPLLTVLLQISNLDTALICFLILAVVAACLYIFVNTPTIVVSAWHHTFEGMEYSPEHIYVAVENSVKSKEVPGVSFSRVTRAQEGLLSSRREYLRITYGHYMIDVCAAPFAKSFFVSWRMLEQKTFVKSMMHKFPALESLADYKTFYEQDTEHMVKDFIHKGILEALQDMTTTKGVRSLSESEMMLQRN